MGCRKAERQYAHLPTQFKIGTKKGELLSSPFLFNNSLLFFFYNSF